MTDAGMIDDRASLLAWARNIAAAVVLDGFLVWAGMWVWRAL